jgi:prepilin-type processing-associated H-X9-DG protein
VNQVLAVTNVIPDAAARSYLMNGFQDAVLQRFGGVLPPKGTRLPELRESVIAHPADTIVFGEKASGLGLYYLVLAADASQFLASLEESRHGEVLEPLNRSGYSNYAFGDGSVRTVRYGKTLCPLNLWAVTAEGRARYAVCRPR